MVGGGARLFCSAPMLNIQGYILRGGLMQSRVRREVSGLVYEELVQPTRVVASGPARRQTQISSPPRSVPRSAGICANMQRAFDELVRNRQQAAAMRSEWIRRKYDPTFAR